jgi:hypothetical protein
MLEELKLTPLLRLLPTELRMKAWLKVFDYQLECLASQTSVDLLQLVLFVRPNSEMKKRGKHYEKGVG